MNFHGAITQLQQLLALGKFYSRFLSLFVFSALKKNAWHATYHGGHFKVHTSVALGTVMCSKTSAEPHLQTGNSTAVKQSLLPSCSPHCPFSLNLTRMESLPFVFPPTGLFLLAQCPQGLPTL